MDTIVKTLTQYLTDLTGERLSVHPINIGGLPYFISKRYVFYNLVIGTRKMVAVYLLDETEFRPVQFIKHMQQISSLELDEVCVVAQYLPPYVRKRLIEKAVSFVLPNVQMYLPSLGMELRARSRRIKSHSVKHFSPATQVVVIQYLLGQIYKPITALELSRELAYSPMTMSRALDELQSSTVARVERKGRKRLLSFIYGNKETWHKILPLLRNPVKQEYWSNISKSVQKKLLLSSDSALASQTLLAQPSNPKYATDLKSWKLLLKNGAEVMPIEESGTSLIQIWRYKPEVLKVEGYVDPFSLFLSLQNNPDERIQMSLDKLLDKYL